MLKGIRIVQPISLIITTFKLNYMRTETVKSTRHDNDTGTRKTDTLNLTIWADCICSQLCLNSSRNDYRYVNGFSRSLRESLTPNWFYNFPPNRFPCLRSSFLYTGCCFYAIYRCWRFSLWKLETFVRCTLT